MRMSPCGWHFVTLRQAPECVIAYKPSNRSRATM